MTTNWQPIETVPSDGREILCINAQREMKICYPKLFPRPIHPNGGDIRKPQAGDRWEYFRDEVNAPGHTWSMMPTHWMPLPQWP